jgi:phospho-N-acetylmuramoyl-pentapeptide-transferase
MFYHIFYPLKSIFSPFNIFRYITFRAAYAGLTAFIITFLLTPLFIRWVKNRGLREKISEDTPKRHREKEGTPTSGGVVMVLSVVISVLLWANLTNYFIHIALLSTVWLSLWGYIDDIVKIRRNNRGISKKLKLFGQSLLALGIFLFVKNSFSRDIATSTQLLFLKNVFLSLGIFYIFFMFFVFVGATNAVNLTDGLDGLATGCALAPMGVFTIVSYVSGHKILSKYLNILYIPQAGELTIFASAFLGALLGFLWYNAHPAEIFMGDTGSQALGGAFGILAILTKQEILLAVAGGIFVLEALSVIIQVFFFRTKGKRVFKRAPLHHHFEEKGLPEPRIVVRFWIISMIFGAIALSTLKIR